MFTPGSFRMEDEVAESLMQYLYNTYPEKQRPICWKRTFLACTMWQE